MKKQDISMYTHVLHFIYALVMARGNKILFSYLTYENKLKID